MTVLIREGILEKISALVSAKSSGYYTRQKGRQEQGTCVDRRVPVGGRRGGPDGKSVLLVNNAPTSRNPQRSEEAETSSVGSKLQHMEKSCLLLAKQR